ncbi:hypothetical protein DM01DRAFT_21973 [Hesseltinella vesiculosa]|uniref:Uncharacterized protein n=1 Tax=Hesseltinella vesiculosa TaxID=101127 RepID=A0A1X2GT67_9FUNG|nr:hypothetical protein DM01DRAFT_21973 [Hesseltinella vesiculosa]
MRKKKKKMSTYWEFQTQAMHNQAMQERNGIVQHMGAHGGTPGLGTGHQREREEMPVAKRCMGLEGRELSDHFMCEGLQLKGHVIYRQQWAGHRSTQQNLVHGQDKLAREEGRRHASWQSRARRRIKLGQQEHGDHLFSIAHQPTIEVEKG